MICPDCQSKCNSIVTDSRYADTLNHIRRRRKCLDCGASFTTYEKMAKPGHTNVVVDVTQKINDLIEQLHQIKRDVKGK